MCEVVKVLERELENSGLIYVYQEGGEGKWYVYERSAYFLSRMSDFGDGFGLGGLPSPE